MLHREILRQQLIVDIDRLHNLILRFAAGHKPVKQERDQLEGAVQIKMALWRTTVEKDNLP